MPCAEIEPSEIGIIILVMNGKTKFGEITSLAYVIQLGLVELRFNLATLHFQAPSSSFSVLEHMKNGRVGLMERNGGLQKQKNLHNVISWVKLGNHICNC